MCLKVCFSEAGVQCTMISKLLMYISEVRVQFPHGENQCHNFPAVSIFYLNVSSFKCATYSNIVFKVYNKLCIYVL
jgi:hypothetical protein